MLDIANQALRIEEYREKKFIEDCQNLNSKYSKKNFSQILGYKTVDSYCKMANGTKGVSLRTVSVFIKNFDVNANWLFKGKGEMCLPKNRKAQKELQDIF